MVCEVSGCSGQDVSALAVPAGPHRRTTLASGLTGLTTTALLEVVATDGAGAQDLDGDENQGPERPGVAGVSGVPRQRSRQAVQVVRLCPSHGHLARLGLVEPYVARMESGWGHLAQVFDRVGAAVPGQAVREDLVFLDGFAQDLQQVARLLEGERSVRCQGLAAALGTRGDALEGLLRLHLH